MSQPNLFLSRLLLILCFAASIIQVESCFTTIEYMQHLPDNWKQISKARSRQYKQGLQRVNLRKTIPLLPDLHEEAFSKIDCLDCAGCCKNYSPRFKTPDIKRISRYLGLKESVFIDTYLLLDEEGDYVVKSTPCPFLQSDNKCAIYEVRPSDCARFPYTNEDVLLKRHQITLKNASFCPAVFFVLQKLFPGE